MKIFTIIVLGQLLGHLMVGYWEMQFNPLIWDNKTRYVATLFGIISTLGIQIVKSNKREERIK